MYINDINIFTKNEKELEPFIEMIRIFIQDIRAHGVTIIVVRNRHGDTSSNSGRFHK